MYLINSSGPYSYSLNAARLKHVEPILKNSRYRNSYSIQNTQAFDENGITRFTTSPVSSKGRMNTVVVETSDGTLVKTNYEMFYPSLTEYFDEDKEEFKKIPRKLVKPALESQQNIKYLTIFSDRGKELNGHTVKYFDFAEQIYPRKQLSLQLLNHYEEDTNFVLSENVRKSSTTLNSLGRELTSDSSAYIDSTGFSTWSTETFKISEASAKLTINDGELMHLNHVDAFGKLGVTAGEAPFYEDPSYYSQTFGYKINYRTRPDTSVPSKVGADDGHTPDRAPYKSYETMISSILSEHPTMGLIVEYRAETTMDTFLHHGCVDLSSAPSMFGYQGDASTTAKRLLGVASYSDEMFELKDIHKQVDKF